MAQRSPIWFTFADLSKILYCNIDKHAVLPYTVYNVYCYSIRLYRQKVTFHFFYFNMFKIVKGIQYHTFQAMWNPKVIQYKWLKPVKTFKFIHNLTSSSYPNTMSVTWIQWMDQQYQQSLLLTFIMSLSTTWCDINKLLIQIRILCSQQYPSVAAKLSVYQYLTIHYYTILNSVTL